MLATTQGRRASQSAQGGAPGTVPAATRGPALALALALPLLAAAAPAAAADDGAPLRLCADPTNLPFSSDDPAQPGIYLEIGKAIGAALGRPVTYDWYKSYFGKRTVRVTLLGRQCDAMIGLPYTEDFMGPAVIFSKPLLSEGYALVSAKDNAKDSAKDNARDSAAPIRTLDDLAGKRVIVQYLSTPQNLLALRDDIEKVTVLSPEAGMTSLDEGKADVAFIWGAVAGWLNKTRYGERYRIQSVEGPGLSWRTAIGYARGSTELRDRIDAALPGLQAAIAGAAAKYGMPSGPALKFGAREHLATRHALADDGPLPIVLAQASVPATPAAAPATAGAPGDVRDGKEIFNGNCAHCHGPDAVQAERKIDLRLLKKRYGDDMRAKYMVTVNEGRPSKGMPAWKDVYSDEQINNIYAYLLTVQTAP